MRKTLLFIFSILIAFALTAGRIVNAPLVNSGTASGLSTSSCTRASSITGVVGGLITTFGTNELAFNNGMLQKSPESGYTNLFDYSYDVDEWTVTYALTSGSLVADPADSERGYPFIATTFNGGHLVRHEISGMTDDANYCFSCFAKEGTPISGQTDVFMHFKIKTAAAAYPVIVFNLTDKSVEGTSGIVSSGVDGPYKDGWYRYWCVIANGSGANTPYVDLQIRETAGTDNFIGDGSTISFWAFGAQITKSFYPLPYVPTNGAAVAVAGETISADISTNTTLKNVLGNGTSIGTMVCEITPNCDFSIPSSDTALVSVTDGVSILSIDASADDFISQDGTNDALGNSGDTDPVADTVQLVVVRWDETADGGSGYLQISTSDDGGATWAHGSAVAYDGSFTIGTDLHIGYGNEYPFLISTLKFYDEWLPDALLTAAFSSGGVSMGIGPNLNGYYGE